MRRDDTARRPGNAVSVFITSRQLTEVFTGFGQRGIPAETVASPVVKRVRCYLAANVPAGKQLADPLLLPLALSGSGSFLTLRPGLHTVTNIEVIRRFLKVRIICEEIAEDAWRIAVSK